MFFRFSDDASDLFFVSHHPSIIRIDNALFVVEIFLNFFVVFLNCFVFLHLFFSRNKEYEVCFYIIMRTFTGFNTLNGIGSIVILLGREIMSFDGFFVEVILSFNMFTYFSSSLWLFYAGLNRMLVLVYPNSFKKHFECGKVRIFMIFSGIIVIICSILYQKMCEIHTKYDKINNRIEMVASSMAEPIIYVIYIFPLFSLGFYGVAFNNLREKRALVINEKTIHMIDRAERKTLNIGIVIMITYTLSLLIHILIDVTCQNMSLTNIFNRISEIASILPQISLPFAIFWCNMSTIMRECKLTKQTVSDSSAPTIDSDVLKWNSTKTSKISF